MAGAGVRDRLSVPITSSNSLRTNLLSSLATGRLGLRLNDIAELRFQFWRKPLMSRCGSSRFVETKMQETHRNRSRLCATALSPRALVDRTAALFRQSRSAKNFAQ